SVEYNATTKNEVTLSLLSNLNEGEKYTLTVSNIEDYCGNKLTTENKEIVYSITQFGSVTFNEIMCNPSEEQKLQKYPYIELYNNENHSVSLYQWVLKSGSTNYTLPAVTIEPKGFVIIKPNEVVDTIQKHVPEIPLLSKTFLSKSGKTLELYSNNGTLIHWVSYSNTWYRDEYKKIGGWSLEQIDPTNYCAGYLNWIASNDQRGGTPGETNSVSSSLTDNTTPEIICLTVDNDSCISLHFNEPLLFTELLDNTKWSIEPAVTPDTIIANSPMGNIISLIFSQSLQNNVLYTVTPPTIKDCVGNEKEILPISFELPQQPIENEIVINEILFNPFSGATEFVELYNKSTAVFALNDIYITKYNKNGELDAVKKASDYGHLLYPDDYLVLAKTRRQVYNFYPNVDSLKIVEVTSLPSIPNSSGSVVLLNMEGTIIEQFEYNEKMHSPLLRNVKGVSLERINPNSKTQDNNNWQSAAEANNFATPTYKNSQFNAFTGSNSKFSLSTPIFSPDGDGFDDFLLIKYNFEQSGNSINIKIFDADGRLVKNLVQNHYAGIDGEIKWDGSDENNKRAKVGPYILFIEYFDAAGKVTREKIIVTLAIKS
ncbi:MAG TPA: lamin tail domain-containing protein, partial [Salinivirgaceae bacterium]|nr:lamin tail domain-containing protein [Salinivirgaceae bacterium]